MNDEVMRGFANVILRGNSAKEIQEVLSAQGAGRGRQGRRLRCRRTIGGLPRKPPARYGAI